MANEKFLLVVWKQFTPNRKSSADQLNGGGFNHETSNFRYFLQVAITLKRTLVVDGIPLSVGHNFGYSAPADTRIYYDLDNSYYDYGIQGAGKKIPYIMREDFPIEQFSSQDILMIDNDKGESIETPKHDHWPLIVVRLMRSHALPPFIQSPFEKPNIRFCPSQRVVQLAQQTVQQMLQGEQHVSAITRTPPQPINLGLSSARYPYVSAHARRGDMLGAHPNLLLTTTPISIIGNLKAHKDIASDTPIYFMTNERKKIRGYLRKLKKHFPKLCTYHDFEHLRSLVSKAESSEDSGSPNNHLLYAVERLILSHARTQFVTHSPQPHQIRLRPYCKFRIPQWVGKPLKWATHNSRFQDCLWRMIKRRFEL